MLTLFTLLLCYLRGIRPKEDIAMDSEVGQRERLAKAVSLG